MVRHSKLFLNAATWAKGSIRVEALTRDWQPISSFAESQSRMIQGNALDNPVRWIDNANMSKLLGKEIRLKFYMTRARIHCDSSGLSDTSGSQIMVLLGGPKDEQVRVRNAAEAAQV
jgi:hypothetical protein